MQSRLRNRLLVIALFGTIGVINVVMIVNAPPRTQTSRKPQSIQQNATKLAEVVPELGLAPLPTDPVLSADHFIRRFPGPWQFNQEKNRVFMISGGTIQGIGADETQRRIFALSLAPLFQISNEHVAASAAEFVLTAQTKAYRYDQVINGVPVAEGSLAVFVRSVDGAVYAVRNEFKPVTSVRDAETISFEQAFATFQMRQASSGSTTRIEASQPERVFHVGSDGVARLCWKVQYARSAKGEGEKSESRLALIAADSGDVLVERKN